jgi:hypothetical protein
MTSQQSRRLAGIILIVVPILINVPYSLLISRFDYPDILRHPAGEILARFHQGGPGLIFTWWTFGIIGVPLIYPVTILHSLLKREDTPYLVTGTVFGLLSLVAQLVGLLRWTFLVPVLADAFADPASSQATKDAAVIAFQAVHQYGGVIIGEHVGQLFTILWMLLSGIAMLNSPSMKAWLGWFGIVSAIIYLFAQLELFATVVRGFPVIPIAGLLGSLLWLIWLILVGISMLRMRAAT